MLKINTDLLNFNLYALYKVTQLYIFLLKIMKTHFHVVCTLFVSRCKLEKVRENDCTLQSRGLAERDQEEEEENEQHYILCLGYLATID